MLPFKILTQTTFTAVTLAEAKSQCRLMPSFVLDDDYISALILASADASQEYLHWMVSTGTVKQYSEAGGSLKLYGRFITAITEITAINYAGVEVTLAVDDDYTYNDVTDEVTIDASLYSDINITYACGADVSDLPGSVKQGILMMISTMYNNREDFITGLTVAKMPMTSKNLLSMSRVYVS